MKKDTRVFMKNSRSARCLLINCNGRTNLVSSSAKTLKNSSCIIQIRGLTDDLILQRNERVCCEYDSIGPRLRNRHSFPNSIPERELAKCKCPAEFFFYARRGDFKFESAFVEQCSASRRTGCQH